MRFVDLFFHDKHIVRHMFLLKFSDLDLVKKNFCLPWFEKVNLKFSITNVVDFDHLCSSNYFYLLGFFFGCSAQVCQYKSIFHLGVWYYSFEIIALVKQKNKFFILYFIMNDIFLKIGKDYFVEAQNRQLTLILFDLNMFLDWNSSVGLFNLKHNLEINFFFLGGKNDYKGLDLLLLYKFNELLNFDFKKAKKIRAEF